MIGTDDPVGSGLVSNLAQAGDNIRGNTILGSDLSGKRPQLLKAAWGFFGIQNDASHPAQLAELTAVTNVMGLKILPVSVRSRDEFIKA
jgi:hypothetical protein